MKQHHLDVLNLLTLKGTLISRAELVDKVWFNFDHADQDHPYFFFHDSGLGLFKSPEKEIEFYWEWMERGEIQLTMEGQTKTYTGLHYQTVFLALIPALSNEAFILFDSDKMQDQWKAFSN